MGTYLPASQRGGTRAQEMGARQADGLDTLSVRGSARRMAWRGEVGEGARAGDDQRLRESSLMATEGEV